MLTVGEQQTLVNYLNAHKNLYIENPDLGYAHSTTTLYQMLGATYLGDGNPYTTGNVSSASGEAGTFASGMGFDYMYQQLPDNYVDYIGSNGGTLLFKSQDNQGRVICYNGAGNGYRSVYSTFNLGALRNSTSSKLQLVTRYMQYFLETTVAEESSKEALSGISVYPNPAREGASCRFTLANQARVSMTIYNAAGQVVRELINSGLGAGTHVVRWDRRDDQGALVSSGTYIYKVSAGNAMETGSVIVVD